jgi:Cd2+/Zn2+-exporting ATPase/Cu+-exporting ATPase
MDCADCTRQVERALGELAGVRSVEVSLASERAKVSFDPALVALDELIETVVKQGYGCSLPGIRPGGVDSDPQGYRPMEAKWPFAWLIAAFLVLVVAAEWFGLFERLNDQLPWFIWLFAVLGAGYPVFRKVLQAALRRRVIAHTLMTLGVSAAMLVGEYSAAIVIVLFMRVANYTEQFTMTRARQAIKDLTRLAPQSARVLRDGTEQIVPIGQVQRGDVVIVRPGDRIPVDGIVVGGAATVNQSTITGESMPVDVMPGAEVFAASLAELGSLRIEARQMGEQTAFGRIITLIEEAETGRSDAQQLADKVASYYLPVISGVAAITFLLSRDPLASAAVLLVACACAFAMATPVAMLASIGAAAKQGLLIKGGRHLEALARADVLLVDKTGTLTLGTPEITDIVPLGNGTDDDLLACAAAAERDSEHPLAEAVRRAADEKGLPRSHPDAFSALPGFGVRARFKEREVTVGSHRLLDGQAVPQRARELQAEGKTLLYLLVNGKLEGVLAAADRLRPDVVPNMHTLKELGFPTVELLTGDHEATAGALAEKLGIAYRANLLPEDKIAIVRHYQAEGRRVVMVGDGVNDAPALAQADVGIAMGSVGTEVAMEAAHLVLMRDDWALVPEAVRIARRTMRIVRGNLGFTVAFNAVGVTLAAFGFLPPIFAAAAQSIPDLGIMANSARLLRQPSAPREKSRGAVHPRRLSA